MKKLSIYIPTYNRKSFLKRQLEFIFNDAKEYLSEIEVIVSDNASDDGTKEMVQEFSIEHDLTYYRNETNLGIVANAYLCEKYSNGEFLWTVGDDDFLRHGIVKKIFEIIRNYPDINFILFNQAIMNSINIDKGCSFPLLPEQLCSGYMTDASSFVLQHITLFRLPLISMVAKVVRTKLRRCVQKVIPANMIESYGHDLIISMAAIKQGNTYFEPQVYCYGNSANASWHQDIFFQSWFGTSLSIKKLDNFGYTDEEIRYIYQLTFKENLAAYKVSRDKEDMNTDILQRFEKFLWDSTGYVPKRLEYIETEMEFPFIDFIKNRTIVLYGAGKIGRALHYVCNREGIQIVAWCDKNYNLMKELMVESPYAISGKEYDYVLIAVAGHESFNEIYTLLSSLGVESSKIKQVFPTYKGRIHGDTILR